METQIEWNWFTENQAEDGLVYNLYLLQLQESIYM